MKITKDISDKVKIARGNKSVSDLSKEYNISESSVRRILKEGTDESDKEIDELFSQLYPVEHETAPQTSQTPPSPQTPPRTLETSNREPEHLPDEEVLGGRPQNRGLWGRGDSAFRTVNVVLQRDVIIQKITILFTVNSKLLSPMFGEMNVFILSLLKKKDSELQEILSFCENTVSTFYRTS